MSAVANDLDRANAAAARRALPTLDELAIKWGTDKRSGLHGYTRWYDMMWSAVRLQPLTVLEIGVQSGASLRMWEEYFPNAQIAGLDIDPRCAALGGSRTRVFIGSQADPAVARRLHAVYPNGFDIIIDDGSHVSEHQQQTFALYFTDLLKPGGSFVIEDLHCAYHAQFRGNTDRTFIDFLKDRIDDLMLHGTSGLGDFASAQKFLSARRELNPYERWIESITLVQSMAVVAKRARA